MKPKQPRTTTTKPKSGNRQRPCVRKKTGHGNAAPKKTPTTPPKTPPTIVSAETEPKPSARCVQRPSRRATTEHSAEGVSETEPRTTPRQCTSSPPNGVSPRSEAASPMETRAPAKKTTTNSRSSSTIQLGTRVTREGWNLLFGLIRANRHALAVRVGPRPEPGETAGLAGEDLVEDGVGLVLVGVLGERELGDEDLPGLGEHALLAGGQATVVVAAPEVADDLGHLDDVAGGELLEVRLVAARPVGRLLGVGRAQHLEDPLQALLVDDVANADVLGVVGWNPRRSDHPGRPSAPGIPSPRP